MFVDNTTEANSAFDDLSLIGDGRVACAYVECDYVLAELLVIGDGNDESKDKRRCTESTLDVGSVVRGTVYGDK